MPASSIRAAFYDLDGTLISGNVVRRYAFLARNHPSRLAAAVRFGKAALGVPLWLALDAWSRRRFNEVFYRQFRGMRKDWLEQMSGALFEQVIRPAIYPGAKELVEGDRARGCRVVLITGALDFDLRAVRTHFGFDDVICNSLVYENGVATGAMAPPVIAEEGKREALLRYCSRYNVDRTESWAYADSYADLAILQAVGRAVAVNPDRRLRRAALERGWPVLDLRRAKGQVRVPQPEEVTEPRA